MGTAPALASLVLALGSGCHKEDATRGLDTGLACEHDTDCASRFCLDTRVAEELVCCVRRCDDGAVCRVDGSGCEFAPSTIGTAEGMSLPPTSTIVDFTPSNPPSTSASAIDQSDAAAGGSGDQDGTTAPHETAAGAANIGDMPETDDAVASADAGPAPNGVDAGSSAPTTPDDGGDSTSTIVEAGSQYTQILPTPDTPPAGCNTELLANGGFEAGETVWVTASSWSGAHAIVGAQDMALQQEGVVPQAGNYLGWLGGIPDNEFDDHEVSLEQPFNVPEDASRLEFKGYVRVATLEPKDGVGYDFVYVDVLSTSETVNWVPQIWSNVDASSDWVAFSDEVTDERLDAIRGKTVLLRLHSETDPEKKTSFWLDSLSMTAACGR